MSHYDDEYEKATKATKNLRAKLVKDGRLDDNYRVPVHDSSKLFNEDKDCIHNFQLSQSFYAWQEPQYRCKKCGVVEEDKSEKLFAIDPTEKNVMVGEKCGDNKEFPKVVPFGDGMGAVYTKFDSGAQKDVTGKPRFDLIPPEAMKALAEVYSLGCAKYQDRNWEKGIPFSVALGALKRHLNAFEMGDMINTADGNIEHIAHVMWWAVALTTFVRRGRLDLNDLPHYNELKGE